MTSSDSKSLPAIGFLTVCEHAEHGLFGGYLVLNTSGRPLEFHCTAPVRPNRAQQILYGPTLKPFLYGEQIGQTLLNKARVEPLLVCTDVEPALAVREFCHCPVILLRPAQPQVEDALHEPAPDGLDKGSPPPALNSSRLIQFSLGTHCVAVCQAYPDDQSRAMDRWQPYAADFNLWEPFTRIRDALEEAQRSARAA